jgi:hypothetical protein
VRGLAAAAAALDEAEVMETLRVALACDGVISVWEDLLVPVLRRVTCSARAADSVIIENALAAVSLLALGEVWAELAHPVGYPPALLASAEEEQRSLPLFALAAALAEEGIASSVLGARVPAAALQAAVRRTRPAVVVVWLDTGATEDPAQTVGVGGPGLPNGPRVLLAGPGWDRARIHGAASPVDDLAGAVREVKATLEVTLSE